jgi:hypothetical protein
MKQTFSAKIDLQKLEGSQVLKGKQGQDLLVIDIKQAADGTYILDKLPFVNNVDSNGNNVGSYLEIKSNFDFKNMTRLAIINIKWMYQEHHLYVQKVIPIGNKNCLFAKTFVPEKAMLTKKTKKLKSYKFETKTLQTNTYFESEFSGTSLEFDSKNKKIYEYMEGKFKHFRIPKDG